jgi:hypothetical protein
MHEGGHSFIVESPAKSFIICTASEAEKTEWLEAIQQAIVALSQERNSKNKDAKQGIAPLWMPDSTAAYCQKCKAAFSLISRRHHCRNCGAIVCDACSKGRYKLEHVDQRKQVRVCDGCFAYLSSGGKRSVRLDSIRIKGGVNLDGANAMLEEEEDTELHVSDEEMDSELAERGCICKKRHHPTQLDPIFIFPGYDDSRSQSGVAIKRLFCCLTQTKMLSMNSMTGSWTRPPGNPCMIRYSPATRTPRFVRTTTPTRCLSRCCRR